MEKNKLRIIFRRKYTEVTALTWSFFRIEVFRIKVKGFARYQVVAGLRAYKLNGYFIFKFYVVVGFTHVYDAVKGAECAPEMPSLWISAGRDFLGFVYFFLWDVSNILFQLLLA